MVLVERKRSMATFVECVTCKQQVNISAEACPHCNTYPFIACKKCEELTINLGGNQKCLIHRTGICYYCHQIIDRCDGVYGWIVEWTYKKPDWAEITGFVCKPCTNDHPQLIKPKLPSKKNKHSK